MQHETQVALARRFFEHMDKGTTTVGAGMTYNDVSIYTDPERFALEKQAFYRDYPIVLGFSCRIPQAGDFVTDDFCGVPVLMVRSRSGDVNAFLNVCRHRGSKVTLEECGTGRKVFTCPYHAWSYDLEGRLAGVPNREGFDGMDFEAHGLTPLPVAEKYGFIWVKPSPGGRVDPDELLESLAPELASYGLEGWHHFKTVVLRKRMNWKMVVDTFLENHHLNKLHKNSVASIFLPDLGLFDGFGRNHRLMVARTSIDELRSQPEAEWDVVKHTGIAYVLFPNTVFSPQGDHVEIMRVFPDGDRPDRSVMDLAIYTPQPVTSEKGVRHFDSNMKLALKVFEEEDFIIGESIQAGILSGAQEQFTYGIVEPGLDYYHNNIREVLGIKQAPSAPVAPDHQAGRSQPTAAPRHRWNLYH